MLRILELFCGIGGLAAAVEGRAEVVAAIDVSRPALDTYRENFDHPTHARAIERLSVAQLRAWQADLWWLSPPCQPFTERGKQHDLDDRRAAALAVLIDWLTAIRPAYLAFENVPGFCGSRAHRRLRTALDIAGYRVVECRLCPTALGIPNRRARFYLVAGRGPLHDWPIATADTRRPLAARVEPNAAPELRLAASLTAAYDGALHVVDVENRDAIANCFTAAYGRSPVRSGSYLRCAGGLRAFAPTEILDLLGFPPGFRFAPGTPDRRAWKLAGNSVSVAAVRHILQAVPGLATAAVPPSTTNARDEPRQSTRRGRRRLGARPGRRPKSVESLRGKHPHDGGRGAFR